MRSCLVRSSMGASLSHTPSRTELPSGPTLRYAGRMPDSRDLPETLPSEVTRPHPPSSPPAPSPSPADVPAVEAQPRSVPEVAPAPPSEDRAADPEPPPAARDLAP